MMTNTVNNEQDEKKRVSAFITPDAYEALPELCALLQDEKGIPVSFIQAASLAITETAKRKAKAKSRRESYMAQTQPPKRTNNRRQVQATQ